MKKTIYIVLASIIFLPACSPPEKEEKGQIMEHAGDEESDELEASENNFDNVAEDVEDEVKKRDGVENEHILFCRIGDYYEPAVMVLDWDEERDENGIFPIQGYYYYLKHGKKLDLEGYSDPKTRGIYLNESYKGKPTGYMEFAQDDWDGENFWAVDEWGDDPQHFESEDIEFYEENHPELAYAAYKYDHEVPMFDGPEDYSLEVTNSLFISWIGDKYMAFKLSVVCTNGHQGEVDGVAIVDGNKATFNNDAEEDWDKCVLEFDLSKEGEISVTEVECSAYHGARAYFDGTLYKTSK